MKRMVYTAVSTKQDGDQFDLGYSFDRAKVMDIALGDWNHMSAYDRERTVNAVEGRMLDVENYQSAKDAYMTYLDGGEYIDPVEYEEVR